MKKKMTLNQKLGLGFLIAAPFVIAACDDKQEPEQPGQIIPTPIEKTYTIELKDGALKFNVKYMALPDATPPAYLSYLKGRLEAISNSTTSPSMLSIENLITNGGVFTIMIESTGNIYEGMVWDSTARKFSLHDGWISSASESDLSLAMMRDAFNSVTPVETAMLRNFTQSVVEQGNAACQSPNSSGVPLHITPPHIA